MVICGLVLRACAQLLPPGVVSFGLMRFETKRLEAPFAFRRRAAGLRIRSFLKPVVNPSFPSIPSLTVVSLADAE